VALETRDLYAPIANRLGIWGVKWELEDLAFRELQPEEYRRIAGTLNEKRRDREDYIRQVCDQLAGEMQRAGIPAQIQGRPKHIYSIHRKMQRKALGFEQLFDVRAVRIIVDTVSDCYAALGIVHGLWPFIPGEFDDYIATPKENDYQSIHTAVHGPDGRSLEIQIRTHAMQAQAELGVAAHWVYKEGGAQV
jgi:GTP pyrophosphokinase